MTENSKDIEYGQIAAGFVGWCLVATLLSSSLVLSCSVLPLTLLTLLGFGLSTDNKATAAGILLAVGINFFISLILGLGNNATCFIPFYMGDVIKEMWGF